MLTLGWMVLGACSSFDDSKYFEPWTCPRVAEGEREFDRDGDGQLTDLDVEPGESVVRLRWVEPALDPPLVVSWATDSSAEINPFLGPTGEPRLPSDEPVWGIWHRLACDQPASLFVWFPGRWAPTENAVTSLSLDIPNLEQGSADEDQSADGATVTLTRTTSASLSGYLTGPVDLRVFSNLTGEDLGQIVSVEGYAFRDVPF